MVRLGYAHATTYPPDVAHAEEFRELERQAREAQVGLWAPFTATGTFVGSVNSDVYHYPSCTSAQNIKPENLITFSSVEEAKAYGHRPCLKCNPPG
jgi:micrococcal nuclease